MGTTAASGRFDKPHEQEYREAPRRGIDRLKGYVSEGVHTLTGEEGWAWLQEQREDPTKRCTIDVHVTEIDAKDDTDE